MDTAHPISHPSYTLRQSVGYMHRDLVEDRRCITEADYREGLAMAPGGRQLVLVHHAAGQTRQE